MKEKNTAKWLSLAALLAFVAATLQIVSEHYLIGAIFLASGACFMTAAGKFRKREESENQTGSEEQKEEK